MRRITFASAERNLSPHLVRLPLLLRFGPWGHDAPGPSYPRKDLPDALARHAHPCVVAESPPFFVATTAAPRLSSST